MPTIRTKDGGTRTKATGKTGTHTRSGASRSSGSKVVTNHSGNETQEYKNDYYAAKAQGFAEESTPVIIPVETPQVTQQPTTTENALSPLPVNTSSLITPEITAAAQQAAQESAKRIETINKIENLQTARNQALARRAEKEQEVTQFYKTIEQYPKEQQAAMLKFQANKGKTDDGRTWLPLNRAWEAPDIEKQAKNIDKIELSPTVTELAADARAIAGNIRSHKTGHALLQYPLESSARLVEFAGTIPGGAEAFGKMAIHDPGQTLEASNIAAGATAYGLTVGFAKSLYHEPTQTLSDIAVTGAFLKVGGYGIGKVQDIGAAGARNLRTGVPALIADTTAQAPIIPVTDIIPELAARPPKSRIIGITDDGRLITEPSWAEAAKPAPRTGTPSVSDIIPGIKDRVPTYRFAETIEGDLFLESALTKTTKNTKIHDMIATPSTAEQIIEIPQADGGIMLIKSKTKAPKPIRKAATKLKPLRAEKTETLSIQETRTANAQNIIGDVLASKKRAESFRQKLKSNAEKNKKTEAETDIPDITGRDHDADVLKWQQHEKTIDRLLDRMEPSEKPILEDLPIFESKNPIKIKEKTKTLERLSPSTSQKFPSLQIPLTSLNTLGLAAAITHTQQPRQLHNNTLPLKIPTLINNRGNTKTPKTPHIISTSPLPTSAPTYNPFQTPLPSRTIPLSIPTIPATKTPTLPKKDLSKIMGGQTPAPGSPWGSRTKKHYVKDPKEFIFGKK